MSATVQTGELPPIGTVPPVADAPDAPHWSERQRSGAARAGAALESPPQQHRGARAGRAPTLGEQPTAVLLARIAQLEGSLGAALSLLRRCIIERKTPTRAALAAEAGFALGLTPEAALAELDQIAQMVGVSSLR